MKARNPSTGNLEEVYVKALDSMPVGSEIDFIGSTSDIPTGWEQTDDYSTSEINTGKTWIDGKPIYRKVANVEITTQQNYSVADFFNGVDSLITFIGSAKSTNFSYPFYYKSATDSFLAIDNRGALSIQIGSTYPAVPFVANIIIEYTKSS